MTTQSTDPALETLPDPDSGAEAPNLMAEAEQQLDAALAAMDGQGQADPPSDPAPATPSGETPTPEAGEQSTDPAPSPTPDPTPDPAQQTRAFDEIVRLREENQQHRQQAQANQDSQYAQQVANKYMADLVGKGWEEEQARTAAQTLQDTAIQAAQAYRGRQAFQDAAFLAGQQHDLGISQVQELANSQSADEFRASVRRLTTSAPTAREQQLQQTVDSQTTELAGVKAEIAELKKSVVPSGQRFGDISGAGAQRTENNVASQATEILDGSWDQTDDFWDKLDKQLGL